MRAGEPTPTLKRIEKLARKRREAIRAKCYPIFFEGAALWKECIQALKAAGGPDTPPELAKEIENRLHSKAEEIRQRYRKEPQPESRLAIDAIHSETAFIAARRGEFGLGDLELLHFERHQIPLAKDIENYSGREWETARRIHRTMADYDARRFGQGITTFKADREHSAIFRMGMGWGLETLTPEELAIFFDDYCPCGREVHDPDSLKKERARFRKATGT